MLGCPDSSWKRVGIRLQQHGLAPTSRLPPFDPADADSSRVRLHRRPPGPCHGYSMEPSCSDDCSEAMKKKTLQFGKGFRVVLGNRRVQAAQMVIKPGESEGGPQNRHRGSDQWLLVMAGHGVALVGSRRHALKPRTLLLVEHGERHEIRNSGRTPLQTLNFYSPPGYTKDGDELPSAKP
jgi:mannose-6-phosphate isomerase-like protein (cupin superfamily)